MSICLLAAHKTACQLHHSASNYRVTANSIANGVFRWQQAIQRVPSFQNVTKFYGTRVTATSITSVRTVRPSLGRFHESHKCRSLLQNFIQNVAINAESEQQKAEIKILSFTVPGFTKPKIVQKFCGNFINWILRRSHGSVRNTDFRALKTHSRPPLFRGKRLYRLSQISEEPWKFGAEIHLRALVKQKRHWTHFHETDAPLPRIYREFH